MTNPYKTALLMTVAVLEQVAPQSSALTFAKDVLAKDGASEPRRTYRKKVATEADRRMAEAYLSGLNLLEVSRKFETAQGTVRAALKRCGVPARRKGWASKNHAEDPRALSFVELYRSGKTLEEIGVQHGITRERVRQIMVRSGNDPKSITQLLPENYRRAIDAYLAGDSMGVAANIAGVCPPSFRNILVKAGHKPRPPRSKVNTAKVERCAQLYASGKTTAEIAEALGVAHATSIYRLLAHAGIRPSRHRKMPSPKEQGATAA